MEIDSLWAFSRFITVTSITVIMDNNNAATIIIVIDHEKNETLFRRRRRVDDASASTDAKILDVRGKKTEREHNENTTKSDRLLTGVARFDYSSKNCTRSTATTTAETQTS